jgi:NAD(P)H-quinone oxidoreductase subunit 5
MKTRRAPEVPWAMALPMVSLTVVALLTPLAPINWPLWLSYTTPLDHSEQLVVRLAVPLLIGSGLLGCLIGFTIELRKAWARPTQFYLRFFQDLFAYDFYIDKFYNVTVVWAVSTLSQIVAWIDRFVIDGFVNLVSLATIFGGNALKYNVSGQSQFYLLTIVLGVSLLLWSILNGQWSVVTNYWSSIIAN